MGNLKQYKFGVDANNNLFLADKNNKPAAGTSGFATPDAVSFWTTKDTSVAPDAPTTASPAGTGGFWFFDAKGSGLSYDLPDGDWVEKGGAAQRLRNTFLGYSGIKGINDTTAPRKLYTCTGTCLASSTSPTLFNTANADLTDALLGTGGGTVSSITNASSTSVSSLSAGTPLTIASVSKSGGVGTVTTLLAHGLVVGDSVTIAGTTDFNGTVSVTSVPSTTSFKFTTSNGNKTNLLGTVTKTTTTASVTTAAAHGFAVGDKITVAGASPTAFNGVFTVATAVDGTHFTYTLPSPLGAAATGTITVRSNKVTATTTTAHNLTTGDSVTIAGASPAAYNGVFVVTVTGSATFTYWTTAAAPTTSASGSITASVGGGRDNLINWIRGLDTQDENVDSRTADVRASIHGDVLHSRPVVLDYGGTTGSYVFYGGNDGVFRAIKGGQADTDGLEQWGFIAPELFGQLKRQYNNSPAVKYSSTPATLTPAATPRDYFFDGVTGSYVTRNATGVVTKAVLYVAMRRGGRFIYALDVTSPTSPTVLWRKRSGDAGFGELGQSWSQPIVAKIQANTNPVLIFGAGYDAASEDAEPPAAAADTMGRGIFMLDALTGDPVWAAGRAANFPSTTWTSLTAAAMEYSIAADVLVVDRSLDGYADRVYAVDVGGGVWRADIGGTDKAAWAVSKLAALGDRSATGGIITGPSSGKTATRKFLFGPDVVFGDAFDSLVIGTGDREHPLSTNGAQSVVNRFYMVKDGTGAAGAVLGVFDKCVVSVNSSCTNLFDATSGSAVPTDAKGWFVTLAAGEKVVNGPLITAGHVIFGTNQPDTSNTTCTPNLGIARRYDVNYLTGLGSGTFKDENGNVVRSEIATGGGFLPSPVSGVVEIDGNKYIFTTDNPLNPGGVIPIKINVPQKRFRTYWKELVD
jgi:type IV pilus assembly protein PilY1